MATSAYSNFLSNPELIPRMSGESVADALARVQGWHDTAIQRVDGSNQLRTQYNQTAQPGDEMPYRDYGAPLPLDNYTTGSGDMAESVWRYLSDETDRAPRTDVLPENYNNIYNPNSQSAPASYDPATGIAKVPGYVPKFGEVTTVGQANTAGQLTTRQPSKASVPSAGGRGYNMTRQTVGAAGNDMLGAGNANYQSDLIRGLRESTGTPRSNNPGVTLTAMTPTAGGAASPAPAPSAGGSIFSPEIVQPDLASADDVANWSDYSAYRIGQVGQSKPALSFQEWLAQREAAPAPAPATPPGPTAPPINWNEHFA